MSKDKKQNSDAAAKIEQEKKDTTPKKVVDTKKEVAAAALPNSIVAIHNMARNLLHRLNVASGVLSVLKVFLAGIVFVLDLIAVIRGKKPLKEFFCLETLKNLVFLGLTLAMLIAPVFTLIFTLGIACIDYATQLVKTIKKASANKVIDLILTIGVMVALALCIVFPQFALVCTIITGAAAVILMRKKIFKGLKFLSKKLANSKLGKLISRIANAIKNRIKPNNKFAQKAELSKVDETSDNNSTNANEKSENSSLQIIHTIKINSAEPEEATEDKQTAPETATTVPAVTIESTATSNKNTDTLVESTPETSLHENSARFFINIGSHRRNPIEIIDPEEESPTAVYN